MFRSGMKECEERNIKIYDQFDIFKVFLEFVYSNRIPKDLSVDDYIQLMEIADRYLMDYLKSKCEIQLKNRLNTNNAFQLFNVAEQYKANLLKYHCVKYVATFLDVYEGNLPDELKKEVDEYLKQLNQKT